MANILRHHYMEYASTTCHSMLRVPNLAETQGCPSERCPGATTPSRLHQQASGTNFAIQHMVVNAQCSHNLLEERPAGLTNERCSSRSRRPIGSLSPLRHTTRRCCIELFFIRPIFDK